MEVEEKIENYREKQRLIALKRAKKQEELELLDEQYKKLSVQIEQLGNTVLHQELKAMHLSTMEAANFLRAMQKSGVMPQEALELFQTTEEVQKTSEQETINGGEHDGMV